ncbi:MAG: FtsW/RodA/SpoVE family cell cycle protein, partial [Acidimicrobiales bacterium]
DHDGRPTRLIVLPILRRNTELGLIVLAVLVTGSAYTLTSLGRNASLPADIGPFLVVVLALLVAAHIATRRLAPGADGLLLPLAALLNGIGYVFITRLNEELADNQATWTLVGIGAFVATLVVVRRARDLQRFRYTLMLGGLVLLLLPLVPGVGRTINGARIWVSLGPLNFQPGEFAKIALAIFFAGYLVERREVLGMATWPRFAQVLPDPKHLGPVLLAWGVSLVVMVYEKDLGSSLLFFALFIVLVWVATERTAYLGMGALLFGAGATFAYRSFSHVQERVAMWLNPWQDRTDDGFQVIQSWFAMAWGGVAGTGLGLGNPDRIPVAETDFIFAAIAEELGLLGAAAVIVAYLLMVGAGLRIAVRAEAPFEKLLATGLTVLLAVQSFIIMAGVTRLLPLTGVTLPFVSYGGSSLVANYILLALLVRLSDDTARRELELSGTS